MLANLLTYQFFFACPSLSLIISTLYCGGKKQRTNERKKFQYVFSHLVSPALFLISKMPSCQILSCQEVIQLWNHFFTSIIYFNIWKKQKSEILFSSSLEQKKQNQL